MMVFVFVVSLVFIVVGIPVLSGTIIKLRKIEVEKGRHASKEDEALILDEIYLGIKDLRHRVENLETILQNRKGD